MNWNHIIGFQVFMICNQIIGFEMFTVEIPWNAIFMQKQQKLTRKPNFWNQHIANDLADPNVNP